ncbi:MAG: hypothetical protein M1308_02460, partial [Actinobacteria bacterium]|nr:hypothetical protein [Actinomycetota bacterium]
MGTTGSVLPLFKNQFYD